MSQQRATNWSVTINNPTADDDTNIAHAKQKNWKVMGQLEKGANGTPHYQLHIKTPQVRFSAIKKAFPRAHIEIARNAQALEEYVNKTDTRIGNIPECDSYPTLQKTFMLFYEYCDKMNYIDIYNGSPCTEWYTPKTRFREPLDLFDEFVDSYIRKGYILGPLACNPAVRSNVKKFALAELFAAKNKIDLARQTDRQTRSDLDAEDEEEYNNVNDLDEEEEPEDQESSQDESSTQSDQTSEGRSDCSSEGSSTD